MLNVVLGGTSSFNFQPLCQNMRSKDKVSLQKIQQILRNFVRKIR